MQVCTCPLALPNTHTHTHTCTETHTQSPTCIQIQAQTHIQAHIHSSSGQVRKDVSGGGDAAGVRMLRRGAVLHLPMSLLFFTHGWEGMGWRMEMNME